MPSSPFPHSREDRGGGLVRYQLKRQLFSISEDFWIENDHGEAADKVDGKALRIRETFVLEDRNGAELATIQAKLLAFTPTMTIQRGGQPWAVVKKIPFTFLHREYEIDVQGDGVLRAKGDITNHEYEIIMVIGPWPPSQSKALAPDLRFSTGCRRINGSLMTRVSWRCGRIFWNGPAIGGRHGTSMKRPRAARRASHDSAT